MQIKVTGTYADMPIVFEIHHRNDPTPMKCYLSFAPLAGNDPPLDYFKYEGKSTHNVYAHKDNTSTWSIITQEVGTYQSTSITNIRYAGYMRNIISLTQLNERLTSLPSDCIQCTSYLASTSEITSLNSTITNKADKNHTHSSLSGGVSYRQVDNDYDGLPVYCSIKNGFAFLTWNNPFQYLNSNGSIKQTGVYFQIGYVAAPDIDEGSIYRLGSNWRLKIDKGGKLEGFVDIKDAWTYGTWVYPTSSTSLPYPDD